MTKKVQTTFQKKTQQYLQKDNNTQYPNLKFTRFGILSQITRHINKKEKRKTKIRTIINQSEQM